MADASPPIAAKATWCKCGARAPSLTFVLAFALIAQPAGMRGARATDSGELPTIDVVASRAGTAAPGITLAPMTVIDGDTLARSGATTLDELLLRLPAVGFQGVNQNANGGGYGASYVDLRNLNFNRTLVLVNGRRSVLSGIQTDEAVDLANIPAALVERIEVLPDGSAPKYGADAVAGVVNVVLKRDVSGLTLGAGAGISGNADAAARDVAVTYGTDFERGNVTISGSWMRRDPLPQSDRAWARDPIDSAAFAPDGSLVVTRGSAATLAGHAITANGGVGPPPAGYDTSLSSYLRGGLQRATFNALGHVQLAGDVTAFAELSYSDKVAATRQPPQILGLSGTGKNPDGFVIPADDPSNPYGEAVTLQRVLGEVGDLQTRSESQVFRAVAGFEGRLFGDTDWSLSLNHGESRTNYRTDNAVNLTRALQTVGNGPGGCLVSDGCVPADYFGAGSLSPAAAAYIRYTDLTHSEYQETVAAGTVTRAINVLPDQPWRVTAGAEYRREYGRTIPSAVVLAGDQAGGDSAVTAGGYDSREVFTDVELPLLNNRTLARSLAAEISARYVSTTLFGSFPVWKADLTWALDDNARIRGGVGVARRVPAITEAFGGSTTSPLDVTDPCDAMNGQLTNATVAANCRALGLPATFRQSSALIGVANGGNPRLKPESSRNFNVGAVLTPGRATHFQASVDYFKIVVHDAIDSLSDADPNYIPDTCLSSVGLSSPLCALITRNPTGPSAGQISRIEAPDQNIGVIDTDGLDVALDYRHPLGAMGSLSVDWQNTYLFDYRVEETPGGPYLQEAGTFPSLVDAGSLTHFKSLLTADYAGARWSAGWTIRYIGGASVLGANPSAPYARAPGVFYHDVNGKWQINGITVRFGIDNALGRPPPTLIDGISNTNLNTYDVIGRVFYLRAVFSL